MKTEYTVLLDEREEKVLQEAVRQKDMSPSAVIRHFFRMGQIVDVNIAKGYQLRFFDPQAAVYIDPLDVGPKMAPMPRRPHDNSTYDETLIGGGPEPPAMVDGHIDCPCWATGRYSRVEGCKHHPYDL